MVDTLEVMAKKADLRSQLNNIEITKDDFTKYRELMETEAPNSFTNDVCWQLLQFAGFA